MKEGRYLRTWYRKGMISSISGSDKANNDGIVQIDALLRKYTINLHFFRFTLPTVDRPSAVTKSVATKSDTQEGTKVYLEGNTFGI